MPELSRFGGMVIYMLFKGNILKRFLQCDRKEYPDVY